MMIIDIDWYEYIIIFLAISPSPISYSSLD